MAFAIVEVGGAVTGTARTAEHVFGALVNSPEETDNNARVFTAGMSPRDTLPFDVDSLAGIENRCDARMTEYRRSQSSSTSSCDCFIPLQRRTSEEPRESIDTALELL
jgi:hypothetical protein